MTNKLSKRYGPANGRRTRRRANNAPVNSENYSHVEQPLMVCIPRPIVKFSRRIEGSFDFTNDGTNPTLIGYNFSLSDIPQYTEISNMWQYYRITHVDITYRPEYTQLVDSSALSLSVNKAFNSAITTWTSSAPGSVTDLLSYNTVKSTMITQQHHRRFSPAALIDGLVPSCHWIATTSPSINYFGLQIAIEALGTAMTFRSTVVYTIEVAGIK